MSKRRLRPQTQTHQPKSSKSGDASLFQDLSFDKCWVKCGSLQAARWLGARQFKQLLPAKPWQTIFLFLWLASSLVVSVGKTWIHGCRKGTHYAGRWTDKVLSGSLSQLRPCTHCEKNKYCLCTIIMRGRSGFSNLLSVIVGVFTFRHKNIYKSLAKSDWIPAKGPVKP